MNNMATFGFLSFRPHLLFSGASLSWVFWGILLTVQLSWMWIPPLQPRPDSTECQTPPQTKFPQYRDASEKVFLGAGCMVWQFPSHKLKLSPCLRMFVFVSAMCFPQINPIKRGAMQSLSAIPLNSYAITLLIYLLANSLLVVLWMKTAPLGS